MKYLSKDSASAVETIPLSDEEISRSALIAESLISQGEMALLKEDLSGLDLFNKASQIEPSNPRHFYRQGLSLVEYGNVEGREKALLLACRKFKSAASLDKGYFEAWHAWGRTLFLLGNIYKAHHYFLDAKDKFQKAIALSAGQPLDLMADLYSDYATTWSHLAEHSGEALDVQLSLDAFQKAAACGQEFPTDFWNDYGRASLKLASFVNDIRLCVKAINCFKHAISLSTTSYESWKELAYALETLYSLTHDEDHFSQANECFQAASALKPTEGEIAQAHAHFLCQSGKQLEDVKRLHACIEKCQKAYTCEPQNEQILGVWAEALSCLAVLTEQIELIYEAQNKIAEALELDEESPAVNFSHGVCLKYFAEYFHDDDYYYQAIEKFQAALTTNRTEHAAWHEIGTLYAILGEEEGESETVERSLRFHQKALELSSSTFYIFHYALALSELGEMTYEQRWLDEAVFQFERALSLQKNALYIHPDWLFHYACALGRLGDFHEEESYYQRAIDILSHVVMIDPDFPFLHYRFALTFSHLGNLLDDTDHLYRALHHYRLAAKHEEENEHVIYDWGLTLLSLAEHASESGEADLLLKEAEHKLTQAAKLGSTTAYYGLACLYSLQKQYDRALAFMDKAARFDALPSLEELLEDEWLDGLRSTNEFREFLSGIEKKA